MADPIKLAFKPGIYRETTEYTASGGYVDGNLVRFVKGFPQSMGGWRRLTTTQAKGTPRGLFPFVMLDGTQLYTVGTEEKYYLLNGSEYVDITPLRLTATLGAAPLTTTAGSASVLVAHTAHGASVGDYVTITNALAVGGLLLDGEYQVAAVVDANSYRVNAATLAVSSASGGGSSISAAYQIPVGLNTTTIGVGWGTGPFGLGTYGTPRTSATLGQLRLWSQDKFGEDVVACYRDGSIYYYDVSLGLSLRMTALEDMAGANQVPVVARQVMLSDSDRTMIAFGVNLPGESVQDPLLIRWCDREDITEWETTTITTAGKLRVDSGSQIVTAVKLGGEIMVFTDASLHSMRYTGAPYFFGQVKVAENVHIIGPNAAVANGADLYYMGLGKFHVYNGTVNDLDCDVEGYIYEILNAEEAERIWCGFNSLFGEVIWLLPVNGSIELNFYVSYHTVDKTWTYGAYGATGRTSWLDIKFEQYPLATAEDGHVYMHEVGDTDGSTTPVSRLDSWVEAAPVEIGVGDDFMLTSRIIPDIDFNGSSGIEPGVILTFEMVDAPGLAPRSTVRSTSSKKVTSSFPVGQHTAKKDFRIRGRSLKYRIAASDAVGTAWRQGTYRLYAMPDGKR